MATPCGTSRMCRKQVRFAAEVIPRRKGETVRRVDRSQTVERLTPPRAEGRSSSCFWSRSR